MKKRWFQITIFFLAGISAFCQQENPLPTAYPAVALTLGFEGAGIQYRIQVSEKFLLQAGTGIGGGYSIAEGETSYNVLPAFFAHADARFLYNQQKRSTRFSNGSAANTNFIGARMRYNTPIVSNNGQTRSAMLWNAHWGLQRPLGKRWYMQALTGLGYASDLTNGFGTIYPVLDFTCAYPLRSKKHRPGK